MKVLNSTGKESRVLTMMHTSWAHCLNWVKWIYWIPVAGCSGLAVNTPVCSMRDPMFESHGRQLCVYHDSCCDIQAWPWLHTLTAVPRSTQPSTLHGMVNEYQLLGRVIINDDGRCGWQQPTGGLTAQVSWLGLRSGTQSAFLDLKIDWLSRV